MLTAVFDAPLVLLLMRIRRRLIVCLISSLPLNRHVTGRVFGHQFLRWRRQCIRGAYRATRAARSAPMRIVSGIDDGRNVCHFSHIFGIVQCLDFLRIRILRIIDGVASSAFDRRSPQIQPVRSLSSFHKIRLVQLLLLLQTFSLQLPLPRSLPRFARLRALLVLKHPRQFGILRLHCQFLIQYKLLASGIITIVLLFLLQLSRQFLLHKVSSDNCTHFLY